VRPVVLHHLEHSSSPREEVRPHTFFRDKKEGQIILVARTVSVGRCKERKERRKIVGNFKLFLKGVPCLSAASARHVSMSGGLHQGEEEEEERNDSYTMRE
jgi:hypothetical protein